MKYKKCGFCNYQVSETEKYCPNCGFKDPWKIVRKWELEKYDDAKIAAIRNEGILFKRLTAILSGIFSLSTIFTFFGFSLSGISLLSILSLISTIISGSWASGLFIYYRTAFELKNKRRERYLINEEKMIHNRINEISDKKGKIKHVQERIEKSDRKKDMERTMVILSESYTHLENYQNRFRIELKKIELIRWRNKCQPIISSWNIQGYEEGEKLLDQLETIIEEGKKLCALWSKDNALLFAGKGTALISQIKGNLAALTDLQKSLLNRQAQLSIKDIRPLETEHHYKNQALVFQSHLEKSKEYINPYSALKAVEELEDEYIRFQSEKEVLEK